MNNSLDEDIFSDIFSDITKYTKDLTLLYVEDNTEARESSIPLLYEFFDTIITANDGEDGLEKFNTNDIDIVISDVTMPKMDGLLMFDRIREVDKDVHLVLLTAYNELEYYERAMSLNLEGYLLKPINIAPLLTVLDKISNSIKLKIELATNINLLKQYQNAMDENLIISKTDTKGNITYVNDKFIQNYGYSRDEVIGKKHNMLKSDINGEEVFLEIWDTISNKKKTWIGLIGNKTKNGQISYSKTTISPIFDIDNNIIEYIALRQDVTELVTP